MDYCVFIHTNHKQIVGALVAEHALRRNSKNNDKFDVRIIQHKEYPFFQAHEGQLYLRDGVKRPWFNDDLQSFTPLRFMPPQLMGYQGRAVVIDPDIFAVRRRVGAAFARHAGQGHPVPPSCRTQGRGRPLSGQQRDAARQRQAQALEGPGEVRAHVHLRADYQPWICLKDEPRETIGLLEDEWNDFDKLDDEHASMIHNTQRRTQPWKAGLPVDFRPAENKGSFPARSATDAGAPRSVRRVRLLGHLHPPPGSEPGALVLRSAQGMSREGHRDGSRWFGGDAPQPRAPRRHAGAGANAEAGRRQALVT